MTEDTTVKRLQLLGLAIALVFPLLGKPEFLMPDMGWGSTIFQHVLFIIGKGCFIFLIGFLLYAAYAIE